jgi:hypothetical protein
MNSWISRVVLATVVALSTSPAQAGLDQWTTNGPNDAAIINSIAVDPTNPLTVYAASSKTTPLDGKVFKSTNDRLIWNPMTTGLPGSSVDIIVVDPSNTNTLYVGTFGSPGVLKSTNGGGNWQPMNTGLAVQTVLALAIDPKNPNIVFAGTTAGQANAVFKSTNGGGNWSPVGTGLPNGITNVIAIDPGNSQIVYAGTQAGFFKSNNGGGSGSWTEMDAGFAPDPSPAILAIAIDPQNTNVVYVGTGGFGVWKSVNGGGNWAPVTMGLTDFLVNGLVLDPQRPNVLYGATSGGFFRSIDGGASWIKFGVGQPPNLLKSVAISQTGTCLHVGTNVNDERHEGGRGRPHLHRTAGTAGLPPPAAARPGAAGRRWPPCQQRNIHGGCALDCAASRFPGRFQFPDHEPRDEPADRNAERPSGHSGRTGADLRDLPRPDDRPCAERSGVHLPGGEHDGADPGSSRGQHAAALVLVQPDSRHRGTGAHAQQRWHRAHPGQ